MTSTFRIGTLTFNVAFSPASLSGLTLWLDASQIAGVADGAALTTWGDLSGVGNTVTGTTNAPTFYKTTTAKLINGRPAVWFDGTTQNLFKAGNTIFTPLVSGAGWTAFAVASATSVANSANIIDQDAAPRVAQFLRIEQTTGQSTALSFDTSHNAYAAHAANITTNVAHLFVGKSDIANTALTMRLDRAGGSAVTIPSQESGGSFTTSDLTIGAHQGPTAQFWPGAICEVAVWNRPLSPSEISQLETYGRTKWATP